MKFVRSALIIMTGEKYLTLLCNFALITIVARLVPPDEFGIHVIGSSIAVMAWTTAREFSTKVYLVQRTYLSEDDIRSAATVMFMMTASVSAVLLIVGPWIADAYGHHGLILYLHIIAAAFLVEVISEPIHGLMSRELAFRQVAAVNIAGAAVGAIATIGFAAFGLSYLSFALGWLFAAVSKVISALYFRPWFWIYRPKFSYFWDIVTFSSYNGIHVLLYQVYDRVPYLFFGRLISIESVGLYNRAVALCRLPNQAFLGGLLAVATPAFSNELREGRQLSTPYLKAIEFITVVQWPALVLMSILAYPVVSVLLGAHWLGVSPLVQIIALAWLFSFPTTLNHSVLIALGHMRDILTRGLMIWPISTVILSGAAVFGLKAAACSMIAVMFFQAVVTLQIVRRRLGLEWSDILRSVGKSAAVTSCSSAGPLTVIAMKGFQFNISVITGLIAGLLAAAGWLVGLWWTRHPMLDEVAYITRHIQNRSIDALALRRDRKGLK